MGYNILRDNKMILLHSQKDAPNIIDCLFLEQELPIEAIDVDHYPLLGHYDVSMKGQLQRSYQKLLSFGLRNGDYLPEVARSQTLQRNNPVTCNCDIHVQHLVDVYCQD